MDCLFCRIVAGELPAHVVFENENVMAFLDIAPVNPGHTLVIPKKHYANMEEISEEDLCEVVKAVKKVGKSLKENLEVEGYNITENNDAASGQIIPHIHFHVIPRHSADGLNLWPQGQYQNGEAEEILGKIKIFTS
jgi:histidine triad (HIT) family protein